ncbi:ALG-2 interacting protein X [Heterostelium album PN500]|uniref:ALG-2 interacting protein X n=1 Tax=Heterostelium pallidum (strain ATCC 26659 / Pp 5 / PN500) TaxID=670386 RepID=D3BLX9_HETP5|nr:ALG-2 interacting protein X [Heterostelium album PN500]EFA77580.1 ALG-2 interacting protein X [Heterostelium album PN500]|eukprot:XP_020429708.1 ALG-2 interacting protein X [Heterostelium album PN500]
MLSVERKRTEKVDLIKPLTKYIKEQFSKEEAAAHELQIASLQQQREDVRNLQDKTDTSKDLIWRYYSVLQSLELRFPISESNVRIYIPWTDTYKQRKYCLYSIYYERGSVLFNYGSLLSQQAAGQNRSTVDGIKKACQSFQAAAGVFNHLREYISLHSECCVSPDFTADSLDLLSTLMIAQAQECVYEKAVADNLSDSIQSKLAIQVSDYYDAVYQLSNSNALKSVVDRYWSSVCYTKVFIYRAIANYKCAIGLEATAQFGEQVARLTAAVDNIGLARQNMPKTAIVEFREFLEKIAAIITKYYESSKKDNDTIYHDIVPQPHKLAPIEKKSIAKAAPIPELIQHDPFINLIPYAVKEDAAIYNDQKEQLLKKETDNIKFHDDTAKSTLVSMNLPGAVEALEIGVPKALQEKMDLVKSERGVDTVIDLLKSLQQLHDEDESICTTAKNILNREEEEDNKMSQQYGSSWYRTPSYTLTANLRQDLAKYQSNLQHSTKSDSHIKKKFDDAKPLIAALESQHEVVSLLPSNIMPLNQVPEVANLKALIKTLDSLIVNRDSIAEKLKQLCKNDDITTKLINPNKDKSQIYREEIAKYEPLQQQLNDNFLKQEQLLDSIRTENEKFVRSNSKQGSQREETLQKFANAFKTYNELKSNLGEGIQFYTNFQEILLKFKNKCEDFASEREKEKTELLRQIQNGSNPYSPPSGSAQQSYPNVQPPPYSPQNNNTYQPYVPTPQSFTAPPPYQGPPQTFNAPPPYNPQNRFQQPPNNNGRYF